MHVDTVTLPAFLASALVNGDTSGLSDEDMVHYEAALAYVSPGEVIDVGYPFFSHHCDLPGFDLGAEMAEYAVIYRDLN